MRGLPRVSSLSFPFACACVGGKRLDEDGGVLDVAAGQGVGGAEPVLPHTDDPWVSLMQGKGLTVPTRQLSPEES